jgi:hypothetical protein
MRELAIDANGSGDVGGAVTASAGKTSVTPARYDDEPPLQRLQRARPALTVARSVLRPSWSCHIRCSVAVV